MDHEKSIVEVHRADATWLGVIDIHEYAPIEMTIKRVAIEPNAKFENGRSQRVQYVEFEGSEKKLVLNATNIYELAKVGRVPSDFVGKKVTLVVEKLKRPFNGKTHGIRIKTEASK